MLAHGFMDKPNYTALVAEGPDGLLGYLVYYLIPFTFDLNPNLFIKELYVQAEERGLNLGQGLMKLAIEDANKLGCGRIKWDVAYFADSDRSFRSKPIALFCLFFLTSFLH